MPFRLLLFVSVKLVLSAFFSDQLVASMAEEENDGIAAATPARMPLDEQRRLLGELCRQNPAAVEELEKRMSDGTPLVVKGVLFDWAVVGLALCDAKGVSTELSLCADIARPDGAPSLPLDDGVAMEDDGLEDIDLEDLPELVEEGTVQGPPVLVDALKESNPIDYFGRCEVLFNPRSGRWELIETVLNTRTILDDGYEEWLLDASEDDGCYIVSVDPRLPQRDIAVKDAFSHLVMQRPADDRRLVRSEFNGTYSVRTIQEARAAHRNFTVDVQCVRSSAFDTLKCSYFVFPREGHSCYIEIESLLTALRVQRVGQTVGGYVCHQFGSWAKSLVKHGLENHCVNSLVYDWDHEGLADTSNRPLLRKTVSASGALVLLARWTTQVKKYGGLDNPEETENARHMLERLLKPLYSSGHMELVLNTHGDAKLLGAGIVSGEAPVLLKVDENGIVDTSMLGTFLAANPGRFRVGRWIAELAKKDFHQSAPLLELMVWLVSDAFKHASRHDFTHQVLWNVGLDFDDYLKAEKQRKQGHPNQRPDNGLSDLTVAERTALYYHATKETVANAGSQLLFLSGAQDKSHVKSANMFSGFYCLPNNDTWWGLPLDHFSSIVLILDRKSCSSIQRASSVHMVLIEHAPLQQIKHLVGSAFQSLMSALTCSFPLSNFH